MEKDLFKEELEETKIMLSFEDDLHDIIDFQLDHDVQIIRGEDYQYQCYIDRKVYCTALTPLCAMVHGIWVYKNK